MHNLPAHSSRHENTPREILFSVIRNQAFVSGESVYIESGIETPERWIFDFRSILLQPAILDAYTDLFFERFLKRYPFQVCGLEVAAIPLVSAIVLKSQILGKPVNGFFIRKSRKKSGLLNMIEGTVTDDPVILVDDLINSGSSFIRQVEVLEQLRERTGKPDTIAEIFAILRFSPLSRYTYFSEKGIPIQSIFSLDEFADNIKAVSLPKPSPVPQNHFSTIWTWHGDKPSYELVRPKAGLTYKDDRLYTITDDGRVVCLDATNGDLLWTFTIPFNFTKRRQFSQPLITGDLIIFGAFDGNVYALNRFTGTREWVCFEADWVEGSICSDDVGKLFVPLHYGFFKKQSCITALSTKDGKVLWNGHIPDEVMQTPTYSKVKNCVIAGSDKGITRAYRANTGALLWETKPAPIKIVSEPLIVENEKLVIVTGLSQGDDELAGVFAYSLTDGTLKWSTQDFPYGSFGSPSFDGSHVLVAGLDKSLRALDLRTGHTVWKTDFGARIFSTPAIGKVRNKICIYLGANDSILYEIDPASGEITSKSIFTERITNRVIVDATNHRIFAMTYANEIYAIRPKDNDGVLST